MPILGLSPSSEPTYPPHFDIERLIRPNILALHPYRCARDDYQSGILLDANENALGHSISSSEAIPPELEHTLSFELHRYPPPSHDAIKSRFAELRGFPPTAIDHVFLGVGSDEIIDLLIRVCAVPGKDKVLITPPTYGMYGVCAQANDIGVVRCNLQVDVGEEGLFELRVKEMLKTVDAEPNIKIIFLCSPGNPTGTLIPLPSIRTLLEYPNFNGIVVVDEAYVDFAGSGVSAVSLVKEYANICVMQTLSKGFGLAAIRLGIAFAQPPLIQILTNTKAPYNISTPSAHLALLALSPDSITGMKAKITTIVNSRLDLLSRLPTLHLGPIIGANHANFLLVRVMDKEGKQPDRSRAQKVYKMMAEEEGIVIRYRGSEIGCEGCLRITVGSESENDMVIQKLREVLAKV